MQRKGIFNNNDHVFCVAKDEASFNSVNESHSGIYMQDEHAFFKISPKASQKGWAVDEALVMPEPACLVLHAIIMNNLIGDDDVNFAPKTLKMDFELIKFQERNQLVVPILLTKSNENDMVEFTLQRKRRHVQQQYEQLRDQAKKVMTNDAMLRKNFDIKLYAGATIDDDSFHDDDVDGVNSPDRAVNVVSAANAVDGALEHVNGVNGNVNGVNVVNDNCVLDEPPAAGIIGHTTLLSQRIVRRLLTTLMHDLYMRRQISAIELCSATYMNLHSLPEARNYYSVIGKIFVDYDDA